MDPSLVCPVSEKSLDNLDQSDSQGPRSTVMAEPSSSTRDRCMNICATTGPIVNRVKISALSSESVSPRIISAGWERSTASLAKYKLPYLLKMSVTLFIRTGGEHTLRKTVRASSSPFPRVVS
jgi:hypothetical protein